MRRGGDKYVARLFIDVFLFISPSADFYAK